MTQTPIRPFLKWAGGKFRIVPHIQARLPNGKRLIEPFVGAGSVFLNTNYASYWLSDINHDLISLYRVLQERGEQFIDFAQQYFVPTNNNKIKFYELRDEFNQLSGHKRNALKKAALFIYLNRHGYNGLCRYNSDGVFNVPFGLYRKPYFPAKQMVQFHRKAQDAEFFCESFQTMMQRAKKNHVVYCDPPYVPLSDSSNFTKYASQGFALTEQQELAALAEKLGAKGIPVLISNHDCNFTRGLYQGADLSTLLVKRTINCNTQERAPAPELLALYT